MAGGWRDGNLLAPLTTFVGREDLIDRASGTLANPAHRLLTLTGAGGTGKTRLSARIAAVLADSDRTRRTPRYGDGVWWIELADLTNPGLVADTIVQTLPVHNQSDRTAAQVLTDHLAGRELLLVVDNCEHLRDAVAGLLTTLLRTCPRLQILATSREPLYCQGEFLLPVPPLSVPPEPARPELAEVNGYEAVRLFEVRAAAVKPGFTVSSANGRQVARLVQLLDGLPLAIELAASLIRVMSLADILAIVERDRFTGLAARGPISPSHHQTLGTSWDWSWRCCSPDERWLWAVLGTAFVGSFTETAAVAVASGPGSEQVPPERVPMVLRDLVGKSIVAADTDAAPTRYSMLPTIAQYGQRQLGETSEEAEAVLRRHASYFRAQARGYARRWYGPNEHKDLFRAGMDLANYRHVLDRGGRQTATREAAETGGRIAVDLTIMRLWFFAGSLTEGLRALLRAEQAVGDTGGSATLRTTLLAKAGWVSLCQGAQQQAAELVDRCQALAATLPGGEVATRFALATRDYTAAAQGLLVHADPASVPKLAAARDALLVAGDPGSATMADLFYAIGAAFVAPKDHALAASDEFLADAQAHGAIWQISWAQWARAIAELQHGDPAVAAAMLRTALLTQWDLGDRWGPVWCVEALAWAAAARGDYRDAALLLGAARTMQRDLGVAIGGLAPWMLAHGACVSVTQRALGEAEYLAAERAGASLDGEEVIDLAVDRRPEPTAEDPASSVADASILAELTGRQREVALMIARGLQYPEIARNLFISRRTVHDHASAIIHKLNCRNREEVAVRVAPLLATLPPADPAH